MREGAPPPLDFLPMDVHSILIFCLMGRAFCFLELNMKHVLGEGAPPPPDPFPVEAHSILILCYV
jgi:hypothetical protein